MKDADIIVQSHDRRSILTFLIVVYSFHGQVSDQHFDLIKVSKLKNAKPKRRRTPKKRQRLKPREESRKRARIRQGAVVVSLVSTHRIYMKT